jgi:CheY-like chemotaxis protein
MIVRSEHPWTSAVYSGMRLLCVGRHAYLSEHLCRYFRGLGADCTAAVGASEALDLVPRYEPHAVVCDCDLITPTLLDEWAVEPRMTDVPLIAVSLTRRPEELPPVELLGVAGVLYLPALERSQVLALLAGAHRRRGVVPPIGWKPPVASPSITAG